MKIWVLTLIDGGRLDDTQVFTDEAKASEAYSRAIAPYPTYADNYPVVPSAVMAGHPVCIVHGVEEEPEDIDWTDEDDDVQLEVFELAGFGPVEE